MTDHRGAFIWYELMTPDVAGARSFYKQVVGWNIAERGMRLPSGGEYRMIERSDGGNAGGVLSIDEDMAAHGASAGWLGYIQHPDVDAAGQAITSAGGAVHMPPIDMPGAGRMAMVADPQGAVFYMMRPAPPDDADAVSEVFDYAKAQHVRWNELQTSQPDAAIAFYCDLFGWTQDGSLPMGDLGEYRFIGRAGGMIGAVMPKMPDTPHPRWNFYVGVDDIDRAADAVRASGGSLAGEIQQIPGGEFSVDVFDPQGAAIGLVGPRKVE